MRHDIVLGNRFVGFTENRMFVTKRIKSKHFFRLWEGLGFNQTLIDRFIAAGNINSVTVLYEENGKEKVLETTPLHIALNATEWSNPKDIQDKQYILPIEEFKEKEHTPPTLPLLQEVSK